MLVLIACIVIYWGTPSIVWRAQQLAYEQQGYTVYVAEESNQLIAVENIQALPRGRRSF